MKKEIILALDKDGVEITIRTVENWLVTKNKKDLALFFYNRFYGRYIKPYDFNNTEYVSKYKNGFCILTSCCLLIEAFVSFTEPFFRNTNSKSERCFGYFFSKYEPFKAFATGGLMISDYLNPKNFNGRGIPRDFYRNVRCGILHNGETRNGWRILRTGMLFNQKEKTINAFLFMKQLKVVIAGFQDKLLNSDFESSEVWITYKKRLDDLLKKS